MSNIGGVAYGSSPWTGLQRLQQPSRADLLQSAETLARDGADAAELRQLQATRTGAAAATQASQARGRASDPDPPQPAGQARATLPTPTDAAGVESALNVLVQQPSGSTLDFALRRGNSPAAQGVPGAAPAAGESAVEPRRTPQALLQAADSNGDQQLDPAEAATPNGALTRALSPATAASTVPERAAEPAPSSPSSPRPVQQGGLDAQAERLAQWMQQQYATGGGGAMAATGSQVNTSA